MRRKLKPELKQKSDDLITMPPHRCVHGMFPDNKVGDDKIHEEKEDIEGTMIKAVKMS